MRVCGHGRGRVHRRASAAGWRPTATSRSASTSQAPTAAPTSPTPPRRSPRSAAPTRSSTPPRWSPSAGAMDDSSAINVRGTRNVLDAAGRRRTVVHRLGRRLGLRVHARPRRGRAPAPVRDPLHRHQGRHRDARAAPRRHGDPARRRLRAAARSRGSCRPLEMMRAGRFYLPAPGRRPDHADLRRRPRRRDRARAARAAGRRARLHGLGRRRRSPRASSSPTTRGRSASDQVRVLPAPLLRARGACDRRRARPPSRSCPAARPTRTTRAREELRLAAALHPRAEGMARTRWRDRPGPWRP